MDINQPADWLNVLEKLSQVRSCEDREGVCAHHTFCRGPEEQNRKKQLAF